MWTDMSEIVRPTRDGIHGREYISTSVDIGRKPAHLEFKEGQIVSETPEILDIPIPLILDMNPPEFTLPHLEPLILEAVKLTGIIAIVDSAKWPACLNETQRQHMDQYLPHIAFHLNPEAPEIPKEILRKTRLVEIPDSAASLDLRAALREAVPGIVVAIRVPLDKRGVDRAVELVNQGADVIHGVADFNGNEINVKNPRFIKDMIREIHMALIKTGTRDQVTLIAGGGIALPEHMAKALLCGTDVVSSHLPFMIALECRLCNECKPGLSCPAGLEAIGFDYGVGRMRNLIAAWYLQLIELMGAMGMREARRLRGDVGRAMFFEQMEEEIFGTLFGTRKQA